MVEEPRKRRGRKPNGVPSGGIEWTQVAAALGPAEAQKYQQQMLASAKAQLAAIQALIRSIEGGDIADAPKARRVVRERRPITDPVMLQRRRAALAKAREARASKRRGENGEASDQDLPRQALTA